MLHPLVFTQCILYHVHTDTRSLVKAGLKKNKISAHILRLIGKSCGNRYKEIMWVVPKQLEESLWARETTVLCWRVSSLHSVTPQHFLPACGALVCYFRWSEWNDRMTKSRKRAILFFCALQAFTSRCIGLQIVLLIVPSRAWLSSGPGGQLPGTPAYMGS